MPNEVTALLIDWSNGDKAAYDKVVPLVHDELHRLAHRYMSREGSRPHAANDGPR